MQASNKAIDFKLFTTLIWNGWLCLIASNILRKFLMMPVVSVANIAVTVKKKITMVGEVAKLIVIPAPFGNMTAELA
ncbi:hypothetical protein GCM10028827_34780 [Mucilaginibacter myungsuensis]